VLEFLAERDAAEECAAARVREPGDLGAARTGDVRQKNERERGGAVGSERARLFLQVRAHRLLPAAAARKTSSNVSASVEISSGASARSRCITASCSPFTVSSSSRPRVTARKTPAMLTVGG